ncbi:MAG: hypothetical protein GY729_01560, partial [Desulfobacteraceae bacterium]|nr:hypothetical protein [Desulfobacteraceae bacterium]
MIEKILISSSELIIKKELGKETSLPLLKKNQGDNAKVLQLLSQGKAALLVNGQKVVAKTAMFLTPGEEVQLKVIQAKDALVLKLLGPVNRMSTNQLSAFASLFSKTGSLSEIAGTKIADLKDLLYDISLKSDKRDDQFLPRLLNSSGISWEKKVASLFRETGFELSKPNLEQLIQQDMKGSALRQLMSGAMGKTDGLNAVSNFSETIENFQLLNHQTAESGRYLLPFPVFA